MSKYYVFNQQGYNCHERVSNWDQMLSRGGTPKLSNGLRVGIFPATPQSA